MDELESPTGKLTSGNCVLLLLTKLSTPPARVLIISLISLLALLIFNLLLYKAYIIYKDIII